MKLVLDCIWVNGENMVALLIRPKYLIWVREGLRDRAGKWLKAGNAIEIRGPYDESLIAMVHRAGAKEIEKVITGAVAAFPVTRKLPSWIRDDILEKISVGIAARREDFARTIAFEAGKPIRTARVEVDRAVFTFRIAVEESKRIHG